MPLVSLQLDSNVGLWGACHWTLKAFIPVGTCHLPPVTFQSTALPLEPIKCSNLPKGFSFFFSLTQHVSRQTGSGVSAFLEASYNSNNRGFVHSVISQPQYYTAALSTFPSSTQKTNRMNVRLGASFAFCLCYPIRQQLSPFICASTCLLGVNTDCNSSRRKLA